MTTPRRDVIPTAQSVVEDGRAVAARLIAGYLTLRPDDWLEPTTDRVAATHAHAVDPATGDLAVVTIAEAQAMERPREVVVGDTLTIYGV